MLSPGFLGLPNPPNTALRFATTWLLFHQSQTYPSCRLQATWSCSLQQLGSNPYCHDGPWLIGHHKNAPNAGTERIDRIGKCQSGLGDATVFSSESISCKHSSWYSHQRAVTFYGSLILTLLCSALHSGPSHSSRMLRSYTWYHAHSMVRYRTDFESRFSKFTLKSSTAQCTVQCALKVIVTREESWSAMAEWVMFDAPFSDTCNLSSANFFSVSPLDVNIWRGI